MEEKELIRKIKQLKSIEPDPVWVNLCRDNLKEKIGSRGIVEVFEWLRQPQMVMMAVSLFIVIVCFPWLTWKASEASVPGDLLYSVKKAGEKVQTTIAPEEKIVSLKIDFANRRLEELIKVSKNPAEEKEKKAKEVLNGLKENLASITSHLKEIPKEEVRAVAQKTQEIKKSLDRTKEEVPAEIQDDLSEVSKIVEEINGQVLSVLNTSDASREREEELVASSTNTELNDKEEIIFLRETADGIETSTSPFEDED